MSSNAQGFEETRWQKEPKIVIAFDIGTTYAAVALAHLYKGGKQTIHRVTTWPGQENQYEQSKIPSEIFYDKDGRARAFGAEVGAYENQDKAEEEGWFLAKHWKLHLHPPSMTSESNLTLDELPPGVSIPQIYADFMRYLYQQTRAYFHSRIVDGERTWNSLKKSTEFVLAHPNGWGWNEQNFLRVAAVSAGLVSSAEEAAKKILFVSEAEASIHFVTINADFGKQLKRNLKVAVCDAGGSTVDTTLYTVDKVSPLYLQEKRASASGAIFINRLAKEHFKSKFADEEDREDFVADALKSFETDAKRSFGGPEEDKTVAVGGVRFSNAQLGVRRGHMTLKGSLIQQFFDPCIDQIISSVNDQIRGVDVDFLLLVGGFGESPYLRNRIRTGAETRGISVTIANGPTAKAVADGAVVWSIKGAVTARATRFAYGNEITVSAEPMEGEKIGRTVVAGPSGPRIEGGWSEIVAANTVIEDKHETSEPFWVLYSTSHPDLSLFEETIYSYEGSESPPPMFMRDNYGNLKPGFRKLCDIHVDLSKMRGGLVSEVGPHGRYWILHFNTILTFGGTEIRAAVTWKEKNKTMRSKAILVSSEFA